jgi:hypothetical protein
MGRLHEFLEDETGRLSVSRLVPLLTFWAILAGAIAQAIKTRAWPDVPAGWLQLMGITLGGYAARAGVSQFASAYGQRPIMAPGTPPPLPPPAPPKGRSTTPNPHPAPVAGEDANSAD